MRKTYFDYYGKYAAETPDKVLLRIDENTLTYQAVSYTHLTLPTILLV